MRVPAHPYVLSSLLLAAAAGAQQQDIHSQSLDVRLMPGVGAAVLMSPSLSGGLSAGLGLQVSGFLLLGEAMFAAEPGLITLFAGGSSGLVFGTGKNVPYALVGLGALAKGNGDNRGHDALMLTPELGLALARSRERRGQVWIGLRGFVPLAETRSGAGVYVGVPPIPFISLSLRGWF